MVLNSFTMIGSRILAAVLSTLLVISVKAEVLVAPSSSGWRYFKGLSEASTPDIGAWRQLGFNDGSWGTGSTPFYYGEQVNGGTLLSDMRGGYSIVFLRNTFYISD